MAVSAAKEQSKAKTAIPPKSDLLLLREKLAQLRAEAAKAGAQLDQDEKKSREDLFEANQALDDSYALLSKSENLRQAQRSAADRVRERQLRGHGKPEDPGGDLCQPVQFRSGRVLPEDGHDLRLRRRASPDP